MVAVSWGWTKNQHQRPRPEKNQNRYGQAEDKGQPDRFLYAFPDPPILPGSIILGNEGGNGVSKVLYGHVGEGVNFHRCRKGCHNHRTKAVDQPLNHENAEIHH